mmetsp:Transcript_29423/g.39303  ORF Transcript_29423/g.39303 Transcript_29423/m.39303 type:complete len:163 (-) Transcript_29423:407-895(-)
MFRSALDWQTREIPFCRIGTGAFFQSAIVSEISCFIRLNVYKGGHNLINPAGMTNSHFAFCPFRLALPALYFVAFYFADANTTADSYQLQIHCTRATSNPAEVIYLFKKSRHVVSSTHRRIIFLLHRVGKTKEEEKHQFRFLRFSASPFHCITGVSKSAIKH